MVWKNVCVCDPAVPQELDTPGLPCLASLHSFKVSRTSIHQYFLYHTREAIYHKRVRNPLGVAFFSLPESNEA